MFLQKIMSNKICKTRQFVSLRKYFRDKNDIFIKSQLKLKYTYDGIKYC